MYVCLCNSVTESNIRDAVVEGGVRNFDELQEQTGCSTECGCCEEHAEQVLFESLRESGHYLRLVTNAA